MDQLVKSCLVLAAHGAFPNERGVGGKDHTFPDTPIPLPADLAVVELWERGQKWREYSGVSILSLT